MFPASQAGHPKALAGDSRWDLPPRDGRNRRSTRVREKPRTSPRYPRILVVEDDLGVRVLLNAVLANQGFIVYWAADGFQAVKLYQKLCQDIDIVLLAVEVPGRRGPQILDALQEVNPEVCCCFMTAGSENYTEEELLQRGARHVLRKPFHLIQVAQLLWHLVDRAEVAPPARTAPADRKACRGTSNVSQVPGDRG
jgi:DNA-binding response OmpR family regulator